MGNARGRVAGSLGVLVLLAAWVLSAGRAEGEAQGQPTPDLAATVSALEGRLERQSMNLERLVDQVSRLRGDVVTTSISGPLMPMPWQAALRCDIGVNPEKIDYPASPAYVLLCRQ